MKLMRSLLGATAMMMAIGLSTSAQAAVTIDFSGHALGSQIGSTYSAFGLTFSPVTFNQCGGGCPAPTPNGFFAYNGGSAFTAFFAAAQTDISFQSVSFTGVFAQAFDAGNNLIASITDNEDFPISGTVNHLTGAGITKVVFSPTGSGFGPGITNLTFNPSAVTPSVPEPATWAMMLLGFGTIGAAMRSRRKVRTSVTYSA